MVSRILKRKPRNKTRSFTEIYFTTSNLEQGFSNGGDFSKFWAIISKGRRVDEFKILGDIKTCTRYF